MIAQDYSMKICKSNTPKIRDTFVILENSVFNFKLILCELCMKLGILLLFKIYWIIQQTFDKHFTA